ncbi:hypothetical protein BJX64DRAFT_269164 [Aspergillus heterothallicus]
MGPALKSCELASSWCGVPSQALPSFSFLFPFRQHSFLGSLSPLTNRDRPNGFPLPPSFKQEHWAWKRDFRRPPPTPESRHPTGLINIRRLGAGRHNPFSYIVARFTIPQQKLGLSMGLVNTSRSLGGAVGVAIWTSILNSRINSSLPGNVAEAALLHGAS